MSGDILQRLRQIDWRDKPESTISSQLIMPMLIVLGYGEHTLHKVAARTLLITGPASSPNARDIAARAATCLPAAEKADLQIGARFAPLPADDAFIQALTNFFSRH